MKKNKNLKVAIVMGSQSDFKTMKLSANILKKMGVRFETKIISAHRTPKRMYEFAESASRNNIGVIIAGAGGSAHLPGMISAITSIPVLGVPVESKKLKGLDSLLSIAQMPKGDTCWNSCNRRGWCHQCCFIGCSYNCKQQSCCKKEIK